MFCMFQQYQVDYEDMQVFMCKCPLVLYGWRLLSPANPRNDHIKLKWRAFSLSFEQKHSM